MKYLKKSDWGNYWASDVDSDKQKLLERSLAMLTKSGIQLSDGDSNMDLSKEIFDFSHPLVHLPLCSQTSVSLEELGNGNKA